MDKPMAIVADAARIPRHPKQRPQRMTPSSDRPPIVRTIMLLLALVGVALGLAALSPSDGPAEAGAGVAQNAAGPAAGSTSRP